MRAPVAIVLAGLVACKGREQAQQPAPPSVAQRPAWVQSRPVSSGYYIGIGLANKLRPDHQETAKQNALNDLASEISVTVEGNSLLHTLDQRSRFDESFTSTIRTRTSEQLEGYELVDSWEDANEYWVYYRLSKGEHARLKAERKAKALGTAADLHIRSKASLSSGDLRNAFDLDLRALLALREYWGENDLVEVEGRRVALVNEVYTDLRSLTSGVRIAILPERCELTYAEGFRREMLVSAKHASPNGARDLVQLPMVLSWPSTQGTVTELKSTDATGHVRSTVQRVDPNAAPREFVARLDVNALVSKELDQALVKPLVASLTVPEKRAPIDLRMPRVLMRATETNLGQPVSDAGLAPVLREELTTRGFRFVEREAEADLLLTLQASTREGGVASGFHTCFLDLSVTLRDRRTGDVVHQGGQQGVKGIQLDHPRAGLDAYKRAAADLRRDLVPAMVAAVL